MLSLSNRHSVEVQLLTVQRALKTINGSSSNTPTPSVLAFGDVGLLYFLNQKQAQLHEVLDQAHALEDAELRAINELVEFMRFIVSGLIVEAERVDAASVAVRREIASVTLRMREIDAEIQHLRPRLGTTVDQAIALHFQNHIAVPQRSGPVRLEGMGCEQQALGELPRALVSLRAELRLLSSHRRALCTVQRLIHGNGARVPEAEASQIIAQLDTVTTFRKALHKIKDCVLDVAGKEDLIAVSSLLDFIEMLCSGLTAAMESVSQLHIQLLKHASTIRAARVTERLGQIDARNKRMSSEALYMNEATTLVEDPAVHQSNRSKSSALDDFLTRYCA